MQQRSSSVISEKLSNMAKGTDIKKQDLEESNDMLNLSIKLEIGVKTQEYDTKERYMVGELYDATIKIYGLTWLGFMDWHR